ERGRYIAGLQGEVGIACRLPATLSGNQFIKIGLFDDSNGLYYKQTAAGMYTCILRDGVETATHQSNWNNDPMNGTGPSKLNLDFTRGIIFLIQFTWYGFGNIMFKFNTSGNTNIQNSWLAHTYTPIGMTSVKNPNLPVTVAIGAGGTAGTRSVYVAGRQYSLLGKYEPISRINAAYRFSRSINSTSTFLPVISIQRKTGFLGTPVRAVQCDFLATSDQLIQLRIGTTLTGANFTTPAETNANDTAVQVDTSATGVSGGIPIWMSVITGNNQTIASSLNIAYNLTEYQILTVCSRAISATNGSLGVVIRWTEEW
ncbi:hypothetical protein EBT25_18200, partial [bacterium]|nr:hypothetical protein [bacterium]